MQMMNWFKKNETRSEPTVDTSNGTIALESYYNTGTLTEEKIMKIPTVKACLELISGSIAHMPIYLYRENEDGSVERKLADYRERLLNEEANDFLTGHNFKKNMVKDYLIHGSSYVNIYKKSMSIEGLYPLPARSIVVNRYIADGYRMVRGDVILANTESNAIHSTRRTLPTFKPHNLIITLYESHDGLTSKGLIDHGNETFKQALAQMEYTNSLYENGALPLGILKTSGRMNEDQITKLRTAWKKLYSGVRNAAKTVVLQEGIDYQPLSMNPNDIQMNETNKQTVQEICKLFNVPESLVNSTVGKQYVSIEQNNLHFLKTTLAPIISALETSINKSLLLESEKDAGYFFRFDTSELLRTTEKDRVETVVSAINGGVYSRNEGRNKLDLPSVDNDVFIEMPGATTTDKGRK